MTETHYRACLDLILRTRHDFPSLPMLGWIHDTILVRPDVELTFACTTTIHFRLRGERSPHVLITWDVYPPYETARIRACDLATATFHTFYSAESNHIEDIKAHVMACCDLCGIVDEAYVLK